MLALGSLESVHGKVTSQTERLAALWSHARRSEEHTSELQSLRHLVCRLLLEKKKLGCDYHCGYCQNWITSQALRDPVAGVAPRACSAEQLVQLAIAQGAEIIASTDNDPLSTSEWSVDVFRIAKARGLTTAYISNGNGTPEVLEYLRPWVDLYKVDLKGFIFKQYPTPAEIYTLSLHDALPI